jgi:hypothetical protein
MNIQKVNSADKNVFTYLVDIDGESFEIEFDAFILEDESRKYSAIISLENKKDKTFTLLSHERVHVRSDSSKEEFNISLKTGSFFYFKKFKDGTKLSIENGVKTITYIIKEKLIKKWLRIKRRKE